VDSLKLAEFLFTRIQETIENKQFIAIISIDFEHDETYGNDYIRVSFTIETNESFENLPYNQKQSLFNQTSKYIFSLSTNKGKYDKKRKMLRILEFRHIYESLASYAVLQFEKHLDSTTSIKVKGIDMWPEANYAEKYLTADFQVGGRSGTYFDFENRVFQWNQLHQLAKKSRKTYTKEKERFNISDIKISQLFGLELYSIHSLLLNNMIPIKIKGIKTIDEIQIHTAKLIIALKKELNSEYSYKYYGEVYKKLINYLYDRYFIADKIQVIKDQQTLYLKHFIIQQGDILQLKNMRIVMVKTISIDHKNVINVEYVMLKNNLQPGERTRVIGTGDILFILKNPIFIEFISQIIIKRLSLLDKWMLKRKMKFDFTPFEPNLTKEMDTSDEK
jgi:hypothetical protein